MSGALHSWSENPIALGIIFFVSIAALFLKYLLGNGISPLSKWWSYKNDLKLVEGLLKNKKLDPKELQKIFKLQKEITYSVLTRDSRPLGDECSSEWDDWPQSMRETFAKCRGFFIQRGNFAFAPRKAFLSSRRRFWFGVFCVLIAAIFSVPVVVLLLYVSIHGLAVDTNFVFVGLVLSAVCLFVAYLYLSLAATLDDFERFQKFRQLQSNPQE
jgi:hypothetical protein